jgi:hypothetical protein
VAGLLYGVDNCLDVERLDGAEVQDFGADAVFGLELFGGDEGLADAAGEGYDGEVGAGALDFGFAELVETSVSWSMCMWSVGRRTGMTKSSFCAASLMGKERP